MSSMFNTTREKLQTLVKAFHDTNYPTMEVNYPGRFITDTEKIQVPFSKIEWSMKSRDMGLPSRNCVRIEGQLIFNHFAREGSGSKVFNEYSDLLFTTFGLKTLDSITFYELQPYDNAGKIGFDGVMNSIRFTADYFNV